MAELQKLQGTFGTNDWFVDEMYEQWRQDPASVPDTWREFFQSDGAGEGDNGAGAEGDEGGDDV